MRADEVLGDKVPEVGLWEVTAVSVQLTDSRYTGNLIVAQSHVIKSQHADYRSILSFQCGIVNPEKGFLCH